MEIYLEYIFLENLIMDFIIIKETLEIAKLRIENKRIALASTIASLYIVLMLFFKVREMNFAISKIFLMIIILYIATEIKDVKSYLKLILIFLMVSVINAGACVCVSNIFNLSLNNGLEKALVYIATYYLAKTFLFRLWKIYKLELTQKELNYTVQLNVAGKSYAFKGFLDTGNTVCSHGVPVIFAEVIDENMLNDLSSLECFDVKTVTLGNVCTKRAYILEGIKISKKTKQWVVKAGVVFENRQLSKLNNYNMILNYMLYTDSMGGIKI